GGGNRERRRQKPQSDRVHGSLSLRKCAGRKRAYPSKATGRATTEGESEWRGLAGALPEVGDMTIDCVDLLQKLGDDELLVLDTRDPDDWALFALHIPGALRISLAELNECAHTLPDDEVIVLCGFDEDGVD